MPPDCYDCDNIINRGGYWIPRPGYTVPDTSWLGQITALSNGHVKPIVTTFPIHYPTSDGDAVLLEAWDIAGPNSGHYWMLGRPRAGNLSAPIHSAVATGFFRSTYMQPNDWTLFTDRFKVVCARLNASGGTYTVPANTTGNIEVRDAGIVAPSVHPQGRILGPPDIVAGGTGVLAGAFTYVYTYYNSSLVLESAPSPESIAVQVAAGQYIRLRFSALPAITTGPPSVPTGADKYRLYRRRVGDTVSGSPPVGDGNGAATNWYLVAEFDGSGGAQAAAGGAPNGAAGEFNDALSDSSLSNDTIAPFDNLQPPPNVQYMCMHKQRAVYVPVQSNLVYVSPPPNKATGRIQAEYVGRTSFALLSDSPGEYITGVWSFGDQLLIFKQSAVYTFDFTIFDQQGTQSPFRRVEGAAGCSSHWTIQEIPPAEGQARLLIYANTEGVHLYNGVGSECISRKIDQSWKQLQQATQSIVQSDWYWASSVIDPNHRLYLITAAFVNDGVGNPSRTFAYSLDTRSWTKWLSFAARSWLVTRERPAVSNTRLGWQGVYFTRDDGRVYRLSDLEVPIATDNGAPILFGVSIAVAPGGQAYRKHVHDFVLRLTRPTANPVSLSFALDDGTSFSVSNISVAQWTDARAHVGADCAWYFVTVTGQGDGHADANNPLAILGYWTDYDRVGLR